jgi:hypothetical protein
MVKKELAVALGISASMVTKLSKRGMPTTSVEAAQKWRRRHLEPSRIKGSRFDPNNSHSAGPSTAAQVVPFGPQNEPIRYMTDDGDRVDPVAMAEALGRFAEADFKAFENDLRYALQEVPHDKRDSLALPIEVWKKLYGVEFNEYADVLKSEGDQQDSELTPEEEHAENEALWGIICGQLIVVGEK